MLSAEEVSKDVETQKQLSYDLPNGDDIVESLSFVNAHRPMPFLAHLVEHQRRQG